MKAVPVTVQKTAVGYGLATPSREWAGFSEVKGRAICVGFSLFRNKDIKDPERLVKSLCDEQNPLSTFLLNQLPYKVQSSITTHDNTLAVPKTVLADIVTGLNNVIQTENLCSVDSFKSIPLNKKEKNIYEKQAFSKSEVERDLNNYLHQLNAIEEINKSIDLIPIKMKNLEASIRHIHSQLKQARLDLKKNSHYRPV